MDLVSITLGPVQLETLRKIVSFHLDNDDFEGDPEPPYERDALVEIAVKLGFLDKLAGMEEEFSR